VAKGDSRGNNRLDSTKIRWFSSGGEAGLHEQWLKKAKNAKKAKGDHRLESA
jgi:hypothetical protein